jgi:DNA invertase Pin-like site-specific DNA recombinase
MLAAASAKQFDLVMIWALDRLGRTMKIVLATAADRHAAGCDLYAERQQIDTTSASGRFTFHIFAAIAELERDTIVERINAGLKRAKAAGVKLGRPGADPDKLAKAERMLRRGDGIIHVAKHIGLGVGTVHKLAKEIRAC